MQLKGISEVSASRPPQSRPISETVQIMASDALAAPCNSANFYLFNNEPHFVAKHCGVLNVPLHVREVSKPAHDRACTNQSTVWMDDG